MNFDDGSGPGSYGLHCDVAYVVTDGAFAPGGGDWFILTNNTLPLISGLAFLLISGFPTLSRFVYSAAAAIVTNPRGLSS